MLSPSQALQKAASTTSWAVGMCDNFVANMFGFSASGYNTALDHWNSLPAGDKHPGDYNPPAGALVFWGGGQGHVAISAGGSRIYSTDISGPGTVSNVPLSLVGTKWQKPYLGWSVPVFQGQTGGTGGVSPVNSVVPVNDPFGIEASIGADIAGGLSDFITLGFAGIGSNLINWGMWIGELVAGFILMGLGVFWLVKETI